MKEFRISITYPMPIRAELDKQLGTFDGWYASGSDGKTRDNVIDGSIKDLQAIVALCPDDGQVDASFPLGV
ncbi:hypothetical protein LCGC14_2508490 [marine sediment metagenome]|uniref:Uncharacterized protein n=1 Tax=marine sediment metagenome TaxID=412755 RepID=A0A0F9AZT1_9ZZZZ